MGPFQWPIDTELLASAGIVPVRSAASDASEQVTQLLIGEAAAVIELGDKDWLKIRCAHDGYEGWCDAKMLAKNESFEANWLLHSAHSIWRWPDGSERFLPAGGWLNRRGESWFAPDGNEVKRISESGADWQSWLGAPYAWGGRTVAGVDCSGWMQVLKRLEAPKTFMDRDASDQITHGESIEFADHQAGDWAFFSNAQGRIVHVGLIVASGQIAHAAGQIRVDRLTEEGIERQDLHGAWQLTHVLAGIRRHAS